MTDLGCLFVMSSKLKLFLASIFQLCVAASSDTSNLQGGSCISCTKFRRCSIMFGNCFAVSIEVGWCLFSDRWWCRCDLGYNFDSASYRSWWFLPWIALIACRAFLPLVVILSPYDRYGVVRVFWCSNLVPQVVLGCLVYLHRLRLSIKTRLLSMCLEVHSESLQGHSIFLLCLFFHWFFLNTRLTCFVVSSFIFRYSVSLVACQHLFLSCLSDGLVQWNSPFWQGAAKPLPTPSAL